MNVLGKIAKGVGGVVLGTPDSKCTLVGSYIVDTSMRPFKLVPAHASPQQQMHAARQLHLISGGGIASSCFDAPLHVCNQAVPSCQAGFSSYAARLVWQHSPD